MFLVLAQEKGYAVNSNVLNKWKRFQKAFSQNWQPVTQEQNWWYWQADLQQAFRLYTLALAGSPEHGAMNRMKELPALATSQMAFGVPMHSTAKRKQPVNWYSVLRQP